MSLTEGPLIITLDGPAGSGKSAVARRLAKLLGLEFLDTGAMYRGVTAAAIDAGKMKEAEALTDEAGVIEVALTSAVRFDWKSDPPRVKVGGRDLTHRLRDPDTTGCVSQVSSIPEVRKVLVEAQKRIGREHPRLVTEGRDQGSVVFPEAHAKFYIDATPAVRATRRMDQLLEAGRTANYATILAKIEERDHRDSTRKDGPLICPDDAEKLDTSEMTLEEVVGHLERRVRGRLAGAHGESGGRDARGGSGERGASGGQDARDAGVAG